MYNNRITIKDYKTVINKLINPINTLHKKYSTFRFKIRKLFTKR